MVRSLRALPLLLILLALARSAAAQAPTITIAGYNDGDPAHTSPIQIAGSFTGSNVTITVNGVEASIVNSGYLVSVPVTSVGSFTVTAVATNADGSASASVTLVADVPVIHVAAPLDGFETGDITVDVAGTIEDDGLDPQDPNSLPTLRVNSQPVDVNSDGSFSGRVFLQLGEHPLTFVATDPDNHSASNTDVSGTRTSVCQDPNLPATDNNDPNKPHFIVVNRFDDLPNAAGFDPNSAGACDIRPNVDHPDPNDPNSTLTPKVAPPSGRCSLRAALQVANAHKGLDVVRLPSGIVTLSRQGASEDDGLRGDLDVTGDVMIVGNGRDVTGVDARKLKDRVFDVAPGVSLTLLEASLRGGQTPKKTSEAGGCIRFAGGMTDPNDPSQVATFRANNVALLDCKSGTTGGALELGQDPNAPLPSWDAQDPNADDPNNASKLSCAIIARSSAKQDGGGIHSAHGALVVRNTTVALTTSNASGGALAVRSGKLVLKNSTLSGNKAKSSGGGLALASGADALVNNVTFAKNKAKRGASLSTSDETGGVNTLRVTNTILGDAPKNLCDAPATSPLVAGAGNLDPGTSCGLAQGDSNENPELDKLATNFGVPTHAVKANSPAIDHGQFATCEPLDERNADRVDGPPTVGFPDPNDPNNPSNAADQCDSGSFEFAATPAQPQAPATK